MELQLEWWISGKYYIYELLISKYFLANFMQLYILFFICRPTFQYYSKGTGNIINIYALPAFEAIYFNYINLMLVRIYLLSSSCFVHVCQSKTLGRERSFALQTALRINIFVNASCGEISLIVFLYYSVAWYVVVFCHHVCGKRWLRFVVCG